MSCIKRQLVVYRDEQQQHINALLKTLRANKGDMPLSAESIVGLIQRHLDAPGASRLPVLVVAAAYQAAEKRLGERLLPLNPHNAADEQTGALGDIEVTLVSDDNVVTSYEMKTHEIERQDIERALHKVANAGHNVDNYIFITTKPVDSDLSKYVLTLYDATGVEFVMLDCIGFLRHFLHLFHRLRMQFLEAYQELVINAKNSEVEQDLKTFFLTSRRLTEAKQSEYR